MENEDYVICIKAEPNKINIEMTFQSITDENKFYFLKREVMTMMLRRMCFCPDNPPVLIVKYKKDNTVLNIKYGYKNYDAYLNKEKDLFFNRTISSVFNNLFAWLVGPILYAVALILILNCFYNWFWGWGEWFVKYWPK